MPRRVSAWLIDAALGGMLAAIFVKVTGGSGDVSELWHLIAFKSVNGPAGQQLSQAMHPGSVDLAALGPLWRLTAILAVLAGGATAYRVVGTALWGAGFGKWLLDLRVVVASPDDAVVLPGWSRAWKRWAVPQGPGLIPLPATGLLAYLPAFADERRRGLHDRAAGTVVIDVRRKPLPRPAPAAVPAAATERTDEFVAQPSSLSSNRR